MANKASGQVTVVDITDAYSVLLTSESYTFVGDTTGAPSGLSCTTQVVAYCGTQQCSSISVSTITCPAGISATISNNNTVSPTITFKTTATITAACEATIPVVVDGVTVNKKFSFAVAKQGTQGDKGATGKGISSVTPQYYISTSKTSATGGSWSDTAPTTVAKGKYLWTRMKVAYTNPSSTEYTTATYDSMTDSRIEQFKDSITLEITGPDGVKSSIAMNDEGKIELTGDVMAQRINVDELMAKHLTSTGGLDVTGDFSVDNDYGSIKQITKDGYNYTEIISSTSDSDYSTSASVSTRGGAVSINASGEKASSSEDPSLKSYESHFDVGYGVNLLTTEDIIGSAKHISLDSTNGTHISGGLTSDGALEVKGEVQATGKLSSNGSWALLQKWDADKGYSGIMCGDGNDQVYLRTTAAGLIPYSSGGASTLGTSTWPFNEAHVKNLQVENGTNGGVHLWSDNEGGNIQVWAPDGTSYWEMDNYDTNFRLFRYTGSGYNPFYTFRNDGCFELDRIKINKIDGALVGTGWAWTRENATIRATGSVNSDAFWAVLSTRGVNGNWALGTLGNDFYLTYVTDTDYNSGTNRNTNNIIFYSNGNIYMMGTLTQSSDRKFKKDITSIGFDIVDKLEPVQFKMNKPESDEKVHYGFIAQDVEKVLEEAGVDTTESALVSYKTDEEGNKTDYSLAYTEFIPMLVKKCQDLQKQVDELKTLIANK